MTQTALNTLDDDKQHVTGMFRKERIKEIRISAFDERETEQLQRTR